MTRPKRAGAHHFHPDLRGKAARLPRGSFPPWALPFAQRLTTWVFRNPPEDVETLTLVSGVVIRLYRPHPQPVYAPAMLWIHGGGLVFGAAGQDDSLCRKFAGTLGITVAAVEYRLAPQHPYPAALDDCYDALGWLSSLPAVDPTRVAIGGASAGGGLAAALALLARDRGGVQPAFQLLTFPMLDDRASAQSAGEAAHHRLWTESNNRVAWAAYLGDADPDVAVPGRRTDLAGLPPAWIGVGTNDLFYAEDVAYADRLRTAGVPCELDIVPGAFHGFDRVAPTTGVARSFFESRCAALRTALALTTTSLTEPLEAQPPRRMS